MIYADDVGLPFETQVDYQRFSVKVHSQNVNHTLDILTQIGPDVILRKRGLLSEAAKHFFFHDPPQPGDALDILLRVLEQRKWPFKRIGRIEYQL